MSGRKGHGPPPLNGDVSRRMSRMPRRDTAPELLLRRELHRRGLRFTLTSRLPGRPDIVFSRARLAVFCDGCFWHLCPAHATFPKNNGEWWRSKLEANAARDRRQDLALEELGWLPVRVWEHEAVEEAADRLQQLWRQRVTASRRMPVGDV